MHRLWSALILLAACHHHTAVKSVPQPQTPPATAKATPAATPAVEPASPNVAVSDDLSRQCTLSLQETQEAPKFDFDRFELLPADRDVLQKVATCVTTGPLKGRKLALIGRADPRGTEEYNLGLGTQRAATVRAYLERLGVAQRQLAVNTRGALDAHGTDEDTWRVDRRVDLELAR